jgi:rhomboid protease GluP
MPMLLHGHLEHIAGNVSFQLFIGSGIEYGIGWWRMAILYILCGVGGVLFTNVFTPKDVAVGASCSGYGLLGFILAYVITNF